MFTKSKTFPFWLFTLAIIIVLVVSQLMQDGIFMDGMIYVAVSKNLAEGLGTFWDPHFSLTSMSSYHEQPPLYFGLLAIFFKVLGTSMYVERLFCFTCFVITAFYIHKIWRKIYLSETNIADNSWLPVLFWVIIPVCFWAYSNHVEETVMAVFTTASVYYIYCALNVKEKIFYNLIISGVLIFLASLTKGIQGMFPLAAVGLYWVVFNQISFRKAAGYTLILISIPIVIYCFLLITNPDVYFSLIRYYEDRYVPTFNNVMNTTSNRFALLYRLIAELIPMLILSGLIFLITRKYSDYKNSAKKADYKTITLFILIGLSGSLPLLVTLEQRGFYLVTVLPFFAIATGMWVARPLTLFISNINPLSKNFKIFKAAMIALLFISISFSATRVGKSKRDDDLLSDIYKIGKVVSNEKIISIPPEMHNQWNMKAYFIRYFNVSLGTDTNCKYFLIKKDLPKTLLPKNYQYHEMKTIELDLYLLSNSSADSARVK